jgi:hypothetical protein
VIPPPELFAEAVSRETAGSKILWTGSPEAQGYARNRWKQAWIGIPFTAFAVFWTWGASGGLSVKNGKPPPVFFPLWGCMFIFIGLCILLSPFFAMWKAGRVFYVVTDRNALIFEKIWSLKVQSFDASGFGGFERVSSGGVAGDILFQRNIERHGKGTRITEVGFLGLQDFAPAEQALRRMMELNKKSP